MLHPSLPTVLTASETDEKTGVRYSLGDINIIAHTRPELAYRLQCSSKVRTLSPFVTVMNDTFLPALHKMCTCVILFIQFLMNLVVINVPAKQ